MDQPASSSPVPPPPPPPPPPPSSEAGGTLRAMAKFAWISILVSIGANMVLQTGHAGQHTRETAMVDACIIGFIMLAGVVCGIAALCGIPKYGTKGLLWPALTGILLWVALAAIALPVFRDVQKRAAKVRAARTQRIDLVAATHAPDSERLKDEEYGFSFDIPPGFQPLPEASKPAQFRYAYIKPGDGEPASVILVSVLGGTQWAGDHLNPAELPAGKRELLIPISWRGLMVDGFRVPEKGPQGELVTFNVQLPLKKRTVQIGFGGPAAREAELRALTEQTLATLEGEPNWP